MRQKANNNNNGNFTATNKTHSLEITARTNTQWKKPWSEIRSSIIRITTVIITHIKDGEAARRFGRSTRRPAVVGCWNYRSSSHSFAVYSLEQQFTVGHPVWVAEVFSAVVQTRVVTTNVHQTGWIGLLPHERRLHHHLCGGLCWCLCLDLIYYLYTL